MTIYLIRHGRTEANDNWLYCGSTDLSLSDRGREELQQIAEEGKTFPVECQFCDHIYEFTPDDIKAIINPI